MIILCVFGFVQDLLTDTFCASTIAHNTNAVIERRIDAFYLSALAFPTTVSTFSDFSSLL